MFTGIITETGVIRSRSKSKIVVETKSKIIRTLKRGESIAVDGACLTVAQKNRNSFSADVMQETVQRTTLGGIAKGARVNLELPATPTSFLSGHLVQGHIDGVGTLVRVVRRGNSRTLKFSISRHLSKYIVEKGSITINGVALTVISVAKNHFTVGIIPHTWKNTSFRSMKVSARANIEVDVLAKYVEKSKIKNQKSK